MQRARDLYAGTIYPLTVSSHITSLSFLKSESSHKESHYVMGAPYSYMCAHNMPLLFSNEP